MPIGHSIKAAVTICLGLGICANADATLYVYELPNGARMITDHMIVERGYKLVRVGKDAKGLGRAVIKLHTPYYDPGAYDKLIHRAAREHNVDFALLKAVMHVESAFNPYAKSHKGARGLMQLMPQTAKHYGIEEIEDIYDPALNVSAGARHLKYLLAKFKDKLSLALAAYNAGEPAVYRYGGIPPYPETQEYVKKVMRAHKQYGGGAVTRSVQNVGLPSAS
jgi:hypothetical protein